MKTLTTFILIVATFTAGLISLEANARGGRQARYHRYQQWRRAKARAHRRAITRRAPRCQFAVRDCGRTTDLERCMTCNAVREGLSEGFDGMVKVNRTVIARYKSGQYADSICSVIYQKSQFSWTTQPRTCVSPKDWARAKQSAKVALERGSNAKLYYHADYVRPSWSRKCIGREQTPGEKHIFYEFCGSQRAVAHYRRTTQGKLAAGKITSDDLAESSR